jgi:ubiquinone/menaquinone biosynthesis C-methylase UbiE
VKETNMSGHKFDARYRDLLLTEERHELLRPAELLRSLGLKRGDTFADIGCGPGFFTVPGAEIVGDEGRVLAADIQGEMLSAVKSRVAERGFTNVRILKTSDVEVPLPPHSVDLALLAFTLDEIDQRARFLHRVGRTLRPDGKLVVIEWEKREEEMGPPITQRISSEELVKDAEAAGLQLDEQRELNEHHYLCIFTPSGS